MFTKAGSFIILGGKVWADMDCVYFCLFIFSLLENGDEQEENEIKSLFIILFLLQMKAAWNFKKKRKEERKRDGEAERESKKI